MTSRRVVVTGIGALTAYGFGWEVFWKNITAGNSAASKITSFDVSEIPTQFAAPFLPDDAALDARIANQKALKTMSRSAKFAVLAAKEAVENSGIDVNRLDPYRFGTSIGAGGLGLWDLDYAEQLVDVFVTTAGLSIETKNRYPTVWKQVQDQLNPLTPLKALSNIPTAHIAIIYNARGNCQTITTACTSSAQAVGEAYRQIKYGVADVMIAGGSDAMINPNGLIAFSKLGVMSKNNDEFRTAARPFDRRRDGFMLGEGAAMFLLEDYEHCFRRGGNPIGEIIGYASTCDAFRLTDEPPDACGSTAAIRIALTEAGIDRVDYVNAHGTGTVMNDRAETHAIKTSFGDSAKSIPVSSTKSMIGHLVAAAGAVEFAATMLAMKHGVIPPTINYIEPDPLCDLDYVPNSAREARLETVLSNSFGFGGQNACLIARRV